MFYFRQIYKYKVRVSDAQRTRVFLTFVSIKD